MRWKNYAVMSSVEETVSRLAEEGGRARVVAGGTDLVVQIKAMHAQEESLTLLGVGQIAEMKGISEQDGYLLIGAATTMADLAASDLLRQKARALQQGAAWLGSPQIRNMATIGGNVVNAMPAADTSLPLLALGAQAKVVSPDGERLLPVGELFVDIGESALNPSWELLTYFLVPLCTPPSAASAMERLARRRAFNLPSLSVAVRVELDPAGRTIAGAAIAAGPVARVPWRAARAEETLIGQTPSAAGIAQAAQLARTGANPRDSLRGGGEYRKEMVAVLVRRALSAALAKLGKVDHG